MRITRIFRFGQDGYQQGGDWGGWSDWGGWGDWGRGDWGGWGHHWGGWGDWGRGPLISVHLDL